MKSITLSIADVSLSVTPCVGVWIEIEKNVRKHCGRNVTPCVGVWIEIDADEECSQVNKVTPCVGVWIEIAKELKKEVDGIRHSLCGSVD